MSFLLPDCVPEGEESDGVDGDVASCVDWFVVWGVFDGVVDPGDGAVVGAGAEPAGRVTTVPFRGGKYNAPFCPHAVVIARGSTAAKHNIRRLIGSPAAGHPAPTTRE